MLDGKLHLSTPEGITLALTPAGAARRGYAWFVDLLLRGVLSGVAVGGLLYAFGGRAGYGLALIVFFLMQWAYPVVFEVFSNGMTPGKRWLGLQVLREDGLPVGWRESALRNLLRVVDFLPMLYGVGLASMLIDGQFRRVGDIVAGTLVVYRDRRVRRLPLPVDATPRPLPFPLTPEEQRALLDMVERVRAVPPQRQAELGNLAQPLTGLTGEASLQRLFQYAAGLTGEAKP
ncbi:RDD family protein [Andreprevotia chitinilytica]|uniref:RDD family protein n=1 Tax=Andreprevotia chitinilytica TaxID=396808 RepID=UPI000555F236|nr:RDD family protein [Andreprevotia chitinilytica]